MKIYLVSVLRKSKEVSLKKTKQKYQLLSYIDSGRFISSKRLQEYLTRIEGD